MQWTAKTPEGIEMGRGTRNRTRQFDFIKMFKVITESNENSSQWVNRISEGLKDCYKVDGMTWYEEFNVNEEPLASQAVPLGGFGTMVFRLEDSLTPGRVRNLLLFMNSVHFFLLH